MKISLIKKITLWKLILAIFLDLQQSQLGKGARLKPLKIAIKNMKRCKRKDGKNLTYMRGICKNEFQLINHFLR